MRPARDGAGVVPPILAVPAIVGLALLVLPLVGLISGVRWHSLWTDLTSPAAIEALLLSLGTGLIATAVCVALGVPLALVIARTGPRASAALRVVVAVPLLLPPLVGGVALLLLFDPDGLAGSALEAWWGVRIPSTTAAVVLAQAFVALPFLVFALEWSLRSAGVGHERAAAMLGAGRWRILWRVTLPLAAPGLVAGVVLCFARAVGEFGATALFAGDRPGLTQTMPLAIYAGFTGSGVGQGPAVALSLLLFAAAVVVLLVVRGWRPGARG